MFEQLFISSLSIYLFSDKIKNIYYFSKLLFDFSLLKIILITTGHLNNTILNWIYQDITNNGCFAIKFIQWIISRYKMMYEDDEMPQWIHLFNNFYENCPIHTFDYTKKILEKEFNKSIIDIFDDIVNKMEDA